MFRKKVKNLLLYLGADRTSSEKIAPAINHANIMMIGALSAVAAVLIGAMLIFTFKSESMRQNQIAYLIGLLLSVVIFILSIPARKHIWLINPLAYLAYSVYYLYGIFLGIVTDPSGKTVTFIAMLVIMPSLFVISPIQILITTGFYDLLFIFLCCFFKTGKVMATDIADAIVFGILGIIAGVLTGAMRVKAYIAEQKEREIGRIDQLTGVKNRNAYLLDLYSISGDCQRSIACVYIDVNGLHELNNTKGHKYGDAMLKTVADKIQEVFFAGTTYRIGGDEFVVFIPDFSRAEVRSLAADLVEVLKNHNYHIAIGYDTGDIRYLSIDNLIKNAEMAMFRDKDRFYQKISSLRDART